MNSFEAFSPYSFSGLSAPKWPKTGSDYVCESEVKVMANKPQRFVSDYSAQEIRNFRATLRTYSCQKQRHDEFVKSSISPYVFAIDIFIVILLITIFKLTFWESVNAIFLVLFANMALSCLIPVFLYFMNLNKRFRSFFEQSPLYNPPFVCPGCSNNMNEETLGSYCPECGSYETIEPEKYTFPFRVDDSRCSACYSPVGYKGEPSVRLHTINICTHCGLPLNDAMISNLLNRRMREEQEEDV